jgi:RHS repeat-associated protein
VVFAPDGTVKARSDYLPFGEEWQSATPGGPLPSQRFTGQQRDAEENLDYFNARSLQTRTGRFNAVDPVFTGLFNPQAWNRYSYALNSPLRFTDPTGLFPIEHRDPPGPIGGGGDGGFGGGGGLENGGSGYCQPACEGPTGPSTNPGIPQPTPTPSNPNTGEKPPGGTNEPKCPGDPKCPKKEPTPPSGEPEEPEKEDPPCQSFGQRWWSSVKITNEAIPGNPLPFGVGLLRVPPIPPLMAGTRSIGDVVAATYSIPPPGPLNVARAFWAGTGVASGVATFTLTEGAILAGASVLTTTAAVGVAFEFGVMVGAAIDAGLINRCGQ